LKQLFKKFIFFQRNVIGTLRRKKYFCAGMLSNRIRISQAFVAGMDWFASQINPPKRELFDGFNAATSRSVIIIKQLSCGHLL